MSKGEGKSIVIKFTEDLVGDVSGNEAAMTITGQEFQHVNGSLLDKVYTVSAVEAHQIEPKTILLTLNQFTRFNNVEGNLTVTYDSSIGSLLGGGGLVESFTESFLPLDLIPKPNPHEGENITVGIADLVFDVKEVSYTVAFRTDNITSGITDIVFTVTKVNTNPL